MGFCPSQLFSGRTVPLVSRFRGGCPRVVCAVPIIPISFRRGIGRRSEPDSNRTLSLDSSRPILIAKAFAFWALTRPCQPSPAAGRLRRRSVLPWALPLSGLPDTPRGAAWREASPHAFVGRRPFLLRRLSALELGWSRWPVFAEPRWSAANQAGRAPSALQRFQRPTPDSSDPALHRANRAGRATRMRFFIC